MDANRYAAAFRLNGVDGIETLYKIPPAEARKHIDKVRVPLARREIRLAPWYLNATCHSSFAPAATPPTAGPLV